MLEELSEELRTAKLQINKKKTRQMVVKNK